MDKTRIPLEVLRVEAPCPADWDAMAGDDAKRFCTGCRKFVHNLSAMPRAEAERLVCESAGELCVRFARAKDGTVVTVDYAAGDTRGKRRGWAFWSAFGLLTGGLAALAQLVWSRPGPPTAGVMVMGTPPPMTMPVTVPATTPSGGAPVLMGAICPPVRPNSVVLPTTVPVSPTPSSVEGE